MCDDDFDQGPPTYHHWSDLELNWAIKDIEEDMANFGPVRGSDENDDWRDLCQAHDAIVQELADRARLKAAQ